ncbi:unnamed protein product [Boreogadus saida]
MKFSPSALFPNKGMRKSWIGAIGPHQPKGLQDGPCACGEGSPPSARRAGFISSPAVLHHAFSERDYRPRPALDLPADDGEYIRHTQPRSSTVNTPPPLFLTAALHRGPSQRRAHWPLQPSRAAGSAPKPL